MWSSYRSPAYRWPLSFKIKFATTLASPALSGRLLTIPRRQNPLPLKTLPRGQFSYFILAITPPAGPCQLMTFPAWPFRWPQTAVDRVVAKVPFATMTPKSYQRATKITTDFLRSYGLYAIPNPCHWSRLNKYSRIIVAQVGRFFG